MEVYEKFKKDLAVIFLVWFSISWLGGAFDRDTTDGEKRSDMALKVDALTGCHYLEGRNGGLIPRVDGTGQHMCGDKPSWVINE